MFYDPINLGPRLLIWETYLLSNYPNRVAGLYLVLDDVAQNVFGRRLSDKQTADLSSLIKGTSKVLDEIAVLLEKYQSLGKDPLTISSKAEKAWKTIRWDHDAIKDLRSRIISNTTILDAFNSSLTSKTLQTMVDSVAKLDDRVGYLQANKDQHERLALLEWLTPLNFQAQQSALFSRRQEGTGQWFFKSPNFRTWLKRPRQTLLCTGIPGAGKTMLSSIAIDHIQGTLCQPNITVAYIYCDYERQNEQTPVNLIASILRQILQHHLLVPDSVTWSHRRHVKSGTRPDLEEISDMIKTLPADLSQAYIIVDALDELSFNGHVRQKLLANLRSLQECQNINLMMTSRFTPSEFCIFQQDSLHLEIRASNQDVQRYVYGHMRDLTSSAQRSPKLQEAIVKSIVDAVDGMFLLAQLHVESLTDKTSPKAVKKALEKLPTGSGALDIAYSHAMQRVEAQKPGFRHLAKRAMGWIVYACRLLTVTELRHALAIEIGASELDEENLDDIGDVVSVCCGLLTIDPETKAVRFVHHTAQEYFKSAGSQYFPNAREEIAASCLTYLLLKEFEEGWIWDDIEQDDGLRMSTTSIYARLRKYPFLRYATRFWGQHTEQHITSLDDRVGKLLVEFLSDDFKVSSSGQILSLSSDKGNLNFQVGTPSPKPISGAHLAAYLNLSNLLSRFMENGLFDADVEDQCGRTPLMFAAYEGNEATVKVLLHRPEVDVNKTPDTGSDWPYRTALLWAARNGHAGTVQLLLEREDIDIHIKNKRDYGNNPLIWAAWKGHEAVLKILLKHKGVRADYQDPQGNTALFWAAARGHAQVVQLLLERGDVDAAHRNKDGMTVLAVAASSGELKVVKLLLKRKDVDVNSKDSSERTVLECASGEAIRELISLAIQARSVASEGTPHIEKELNSNFKSHSPKVLSLHRLSLRCFPGSLPLRFHSFHMNVIATSRIL